MFDTEPKFNRELTQLEIVQTLNWYSTNKDSKDSFKYSCEYFKKAHKIDASSVLKDELNTFGFVCRIVTNGGQLPIKQQIWFDNEIARIKNALKVKNAKKPVVVNDNSNVISIQDRIREKSFECIGELEGLLDEYVQSDFSANSSPYGVMHTMSMKSVHTKHILEKFKSRRSEFSDVLNTDDRDLKEGYSNFTKSQLKKIVAFCDQVILDCQKIAGEAVKTRKPRKRKAKTVEQVIGKLNYCQKFDELKLTSVSPKDIIGAMQLWVYNTKLRKLGCYHSEDAGGLMVKGSSIQNFDQEKSVQKTIRKPAEMLPEVLSGGKVFLRNVIGNIRAVESSLTGRINKDVILLRIVK